MCYTSKCLQNKFKIKLNCWINKATPTIWLSLPPKLWPFVYPVDLPLDDDGHACVKGHTIELLKRSKAMRNLHTYLKQQRYYKLPTSSSLRIESSWIRFILSIAQNSLTLVIDWTSARIIKLGPDNYLFPSLSLPVPIYTDLHKYNVGTYT